MRYAMLIYSNQEPMLELSDEEFRDGQFFGGRLVSPWSALLDNQKFGAVVDDIQRLGAEVIAGCHAPVLRGRRLRPLRSGRDRGPSRRACSHR